MEESVEYQIFVGCTDSYTHSEIVSDDELIDMLTQFFEREHTDFTVFKVKGGYLHKNGFFISENSVCVNIIGEQDHEIIKMANGLAMYMNQERALVIKTKVDVSFI